ncbi:MAG TPA: LysR family transcriptional regulator [Chthoniobacterales bacterium]|jgi:LysR family hydrogen peroxide-inducible transcriptional activator
MEIHQLRYFVAVAEEGSFSRAAEREHVSQPSLSQQIQKLEAELNQPLFDRLPRAVVLTEAGRCLLDYARRILTGIADARDCVAALEQEVAGRLAVGAVPSIALYVLPRLIRRFQQSYPKVTFELFEDTTDKLAQRLEDGTLEVVLASSGDEPPTLERHSLGEEPLLLLVPEKHRLARKKKINWSELADEKFLLLHEVHSLAQKVRQLLVANKLDPEVVLQGAQLVTIASMVAAGLGVTVIPQMMAATEFTRGCVAVAFARPVPTRQLSLLRNPLRFESKAAAAFREEAAAAFNLTSGRFMPRSGGPGDTRVTGSGRGREPG